MPGPLQAAGAAPEPTEYAPLSMDRYITGLWTQRSPLRDADVPYLYGKFYSATRFDSLIDGLNREVSSKLTMIRRPGFSVYNSNTFPPILSFYTYKFTQNGVQQVRIIADTATAVYDATPPNQTLLFTKSAGAGRTRFLGIGSELFMTDGVDLKKWVQGNKTRQNSTQYNAGDFIVDPNGNLEYVLPNAPTTANISQVEVRQTQRAHTGPFYYFLIITFTTTAPNWATGATISFAGLTGYTAANGKTITYQPPDAVYNLALTANQSAFFWTPPVYPTLPLTGPQPDTGTVSGGATHSGISASFPPATWSTTLGGQTVDGGVIWTNGGPQVQNWTIAGPTNAPNVINSGPERYWQAHVTFPVFYSIYDSNENLQVAVSGTSGPAQPLWNSNFGGTTQDGSAAAGVLWTNCGNIGAWGPSTLLPRYTAILDTNLNIQVFFSGAATGTTGATPPTTWGTLVGSNTTDGTITWTNCGPGIALAYGSVSYCYAYEAIDGSVSTASPLALIPNGVLGAAGGYSITLQGITTSDPQCALIDIFRTPQGGQPPLLLTKIPNPTPGVISTWTFVDTLPDSALNEFQAAPLANSGDPAPAGATAPTYHLQRVWMIVGSRVIWSGGPDTLVGNGNTTFPPANTMDFGEALTRTLPLTTNQGAALVIIGTANSYAIIGNGTAAQPFTPVSWMVGVGALSYDAITVVGSTPYIYTNNSKFVSLDPSAGYVESGFPIGDQLANVTTGGFSGAIFNPATAYVTWMEKNSGDSAVYLANGAGQWFRYSPVAAPESGYLWSPLAAISGGASAMQAVETSTGKFDLLVGPASGTPGPILKRDPTVNTDNGTVYPSWMVIGNISLCESGEVAEIAHVALDTTRVGNRPTVGMLYGEIAPTANIGFDTLQWTSADPPTFPESQTLYSDRYVTEQDGVCPKCTHCQIKFDWGSQAIPDELHTHTIYGAKFAERRQAA